MKRLVMRAVAAAAWLCALGAMPPASAQQGPTRLGEISSYTAAVAMFGETYRRGLDRAIEPINASGGVLERKIAND